MIHPVLLLISSYIIYRMMQNNNLICVTGDADTDLCFEKTPELLALYKKHDFNSIPKTIQDCTPEKFEQFSKQKRSLYKIIAQALDTGIAEADEMPMNILAQQFLTMGNLNHCLGDVEYAEQFFKGAENFQAKFTEKDQSRRQRNKNILNQFSEQQHSHQRDIKNNKNQEYFKVKHSRPYL